MVPVEYTATDAPENFLHYGGPGRHIAVEEVQRDHAYSDHVFDVWNKAGKRCGVRVHTWVSERTAVEAREDVYQARSKWSGTRYMLGYQILRDEVASGGVGEWGAHRTADGLDAGVKSLVAREQRRAAHQYRKYARKEKPMSDILTARIVQCQFKGSQKLYAYFTDDQTITVGDKVLVVSPNGEYSNAVADPSGAIAGYLTLVTVASVEETPETVRNVREWIVCKPDLTKWRERKEREQRRATIEAKIKRAVAEARNRIDVAELAKNSPELTALITELNTI